VAARYDEQPLFCLKVRGSVVTPPQGPNVAGSSPRPGRPPVPEGDVRAQLRMEMTPPCGPPFNAPRTRRRPLPPCPGGRNAWGSGPKALRALDLGPRRPARRFFTGRVIGLY